MKFKLTDYHVHTAKWSIDIDENGPYFEDYIKIAENNQINICFLEHYELYSIEKDKNNPFYNGNINNYLEELDELKETYDFILCGLEVDYYKDREIELLEFMDDYEKELDFIGGTVHEWIFGYPVTTKKKLIEFLEKKKMKDIIDEYFETTKMMINSQIFRNICHIDTIFRYINENDIKPEDDCDVSESRVLDLGRLCIKNKIQIEYNLSGNRFSIGRSFPSKMLTTQLLKEGGKFFVGSDSHSLDYFESQIPNVKKAYLFINSI
ncbi:MAG: PHP domain-containing protein [Promethearchaeota archaeon]